MNRTLRFVCAAGAAMLLATSALAQGRSAGRAGGAGGAPFGTGASAGSRVGTPSTPASGGVGRDFGTSVRDSARINRQSSHANEQAVANANANAGLGAASATVILDDAAPATEQCTTTPGQAAEAQGSPFNPEGRAGEALGNNPADPDEPIAVARYNNACAHQVEQN